MATIVTGEKYYKIDGQLCEIKRQLRQPNGYPYDPDILSDRLQDMIEGLLRFFFVLRIWLRATVGGQSREDIKKDLTETDAGNGLTFAIEPEAVGLLDRCCMSQKPEEADFAVASLQTLGFTRKPTTMEFMNNDFLAKFSLELCRPDDAPSIRKAWRNQPDRDWLAVAMEPIYSVDSWKVFCLLRRGNILWLYTDDNAESDVRWDIDRSLIFRVCKFQRPQL